MFFSFYYLKGTYQQYLAACELKRRGWYYHSRFMTWMKRDTSGKSKEKRTLYFDYENEWRIRVSTSAELQIDDCKHLETELVVPTDQEL